MLVEVEVFVFVHVSIDELHWLSSSFQDDVVSMRQHLILPLIEIYLPVLAFLMREVYVRWILLLRTLVIILQEKVY